MSTIYDLISKWKFNLGDEPNAWQKGFDDSNWTEITIPHDWSVEQPFCIDNSSGTGYLPGGIGYYRKQFFIPKELENKKVYIVFDGVYNNSMVWCNSYYLGKHPYGYTQFIYDITDLVHFGEEDNVVTVKVNHKDIADSRWFTGSGVYRKVKIVVKDKICIDNYGVFVSTKECSEDKATLNIQTCVLNETDCQTSIKVKNSIYYNGTYVSSIENNCDVNSNDKLNLEQQIELASPNLWSVDSPNLYSCITEIIKDGITIDSEETIIGIRSFKFDANKGLTLNGKNIKLKGVCVHHDVGCLGAAARLKVWHRRLLSLKQMGCNAIRMAHNPHMPELYDLCDKLGFIVIDEAFDEWEGVKNKWSTGHNVYPPKHFGYYEDFPMWHEIDLSTLILQNRNHASIIMWSIGNEIDYPNDPYCHSAFKTMTGNNDLNKPAAEREYNPNKPNAQRLTTIAKKLAAIVKKYDKTRAVNCALAFPELSNIIGLADCLDVVGYNYKEHLYEQDHKQYPNRILLGTENTKGLEEWLYVKNNDYISGQFLWTGFDFLGETTIWPNHGSKSGLLDIAGFKKSSFYFRQSLWSDEPVLKIFTTPNDNFNIVNDNMLPYWNYAKNENINVVCFTNCDEVELFLNGKSLGTQTLDENKGYLVWNVKFEEGELKAVAKNNIKYEDIVRTTKPAVSIKLNCLDETIKADSYDMAHIEVKAVDIDGNLDYNSNDMIYVSIEGEGKIIGIENGDLEDNTPYSQKYRRLHNGRALIMVSSTDSKGNIKLKVKSDKLKSDEINLISI